MAQVFDLKKVVGAGLEFLKGLRTKKAESVIGVDVGSSVIKVVQLRAKEGKAVLETYGALFLGPYADLDMGEVTSLPEDKLSSALSNLLKETDITSRSAAFAIPASASLIFVLEFPSTISRSKLPSVIPTEARKYVPVPISEVSLDWFVVPEQEEFYEETAKPKAKKTEVLVVAIPNDTISKYREIMKGAELESSYFEHETFASIRSSFGREMAPLALFDFGASRVKISIVERGIVKVFHTINRGSRDISRALSNALEIPFDQAEKRKKEIGLSGTGEEQNITNTIRSSIDYIFSEADSIILQYEKKYSKIVSKIVLSGGGSLLSGFLEEAKENFRSDVVFSDPFGKVQSPEFLTPTLETIGPQFAVAVGLALGKLK